MEALLSQAKRVPADKLDWKPLEAGRSVLDQLQECAVIAGFYKSLLATYLMPEFGPEFMADYNKARAELDTMAKVESMLRENTATAVAAIRRAVPDDVIENEMPFFGPEPWKVYSVMNAHAWNMHYHTGQICYVQTLLGDKDMR